MTEVLLLTFGSRGDVQPYIALGRALSARGASVTLCTSKTFNETIERDGLTAAPLSIDAHALAQTPEMKRAVRSVRGRLAAMRAGKELVARQLDETWEITKRLRPEVIVYHPKVAAAPYFARALGAVAIPSFLQPGFIPTRHLPPVIISLPDFGALGNHVSNAVVDRLIQFGFRSLVTPWLKRQPDLIADGLIPTFEGYHPESAVVPRLHAFSSHIVPKPNDWPQRDIVTGSWFLDENNAQPDDALKRFLSSGAPPIYIGFGSMPDANPGETARRIAEAVRLSGCRAVWATGWSEPFFSGAPDSIHVVQSVPHDWLFPHCAGIVHHGGAGTTHQGLRCGAPTLVCPVFGDQPFWGRRVAAIGAGPAPIAMKRLSVPKLAAALTDLQQPHYRTAAEAIGQAMRLENGTAKAAEVTLAQGRFLK